MTSRIPTTFHESFSLNRPAISRIIELAQGLDRDLTFEDIKSNTALGPNYVLSMPKYAAGCGFMEVSKNALTPLGKQVAVCDPDLTDVRTLWLMHTHLAAASGPGPFFWHHLFCKIRQGEILQRSEVAQKIAKVHQEVSGKELAKRSAETTATIFLKTYEEESGLKSLGILEACPKEPASYLVCQPRVPPISVFSYALGMFWEANLGPRDETLLKSLTVPGGVSTLFFIGSGMIGSMLSEMQDKGLVEVIRDAPPFTVKRRWRSLNSLLEQIYA